LRVDGRWLRGLLSASGDRELSAVLADVASGSDVEEISNHGRLCLPSLAQADGRRVERLLCAGWQSSSDGWVDRYLNRKVSAVWTRWLLKTPLTPNHVTLISLAVGLLAALSFAQVGWVSGVVGALLLQCSAIIDCCDGEIARLKFQESPGGYYLDIACDNAVHVAVFVAIAWSSYRATGGNHILVLGGLAAFGTLASFVIVLATRHGRGRQTLMLLDRAIDALTNRDFSVILLLGALVGRLEWFLWGLAVGVNVFWPTALGLAWKARRVAHG
jgi:phosphatidylglycerophosphate synthase